MIPQSYIAAKSGGFSTYFSGSRCCRGHVAKRWTSSRRCTLCVAEDRANNPRKPTPGYHREYYIRNKARYQANGKAWVAKNRERVGDISARWRKGHKAEWARMQAEYRAMKQNATPSWANATAINQFYVEAARLTKETGVPHHVDHIYPLKSDWVCGLHVETNLRVITARENIQKRNFKTAIHT